ncbi:MFS transporter [Paraburkholderia panacisoli]|uniref:MFS transporter n=1 Tax=Paraburkholderia panacisoli TaxID=2603818 RepID=A0A5B0H883_9BURK|nr:MFS transporter [Paraburkholderia panacisoli]KAA1011387.1 MFS transporter [Paraburkholderia panacisoli]
MHDAATEPATQAGRETNSSAALLRTHWQIIFAATAGWALDAFDFTIVLFLIPHLGKVFDVGLPAMAFIITATGFAKIVGTIGWGLAADRFGRKLAFMAAVLWFSCASGLSGLAWSYASFMALRVLFGLGFGGEWTASVSLLMETVPEKIRPLASGIMVAGYEFGYMLAALAFHFLFPALGWRWMFFLGVAPAILTLFLRRNVKESDDWARQRQQKREGRTFKPFLFNPAVAQAWAFSAGINFMLWAVQVLYPTFLLTTQHLDSGSIFPFVVAYSVGSVIGKPLSGYAASRFGERPTITVFMLIVIPSTVLYTLVSNHFQLGAGAFLMGMFANGLFGILPLYQARRFPVEARATGIGISYAMTSVSVAAPYVIALVTPSLGLRFAMASFIAAGALLLIAISVFDTSRWMPDESASPEARSDRDDAGGDASFAMADAAR